MGDPREFPRPYGHHGALSGEQRSTTPPTQAGRSAGRACHAGTNHRGTPRTRTGEPRPARRSRCWPQRLEAPQRNGHSTGPPRASDHTSSRTGARRRRTHHQHAAHHLGFTGRPRQPRRPISLHRGPHAQLPGCTRDRVLHDRAGSMACFSTDHPAPPQRLSGDERGLAQRCEACSRRT